MTFLQPHNEHLIPPRIRECLTGLSQSAPRFYRQQEVGEASLVMLSVLQLWHLLRSVSIMTVFYNWQRTNIATKCNENAIKSLEGKSLITALLQRLS